MLRTAWRAARRVVIAVVGSLVLLAGLVLLVTPGPAFVVIPIGLGILALEFPWARRWLDAVRERVRRAVGRGDEEHGARPDA
jgi:tellurite resistance protein TerC